MPIGPCPACKVRSSASSSCPAQGINISGDLEKKNPNTSKADPRVSIRLRQLVLSSFGYIGVFQQPQSSVAVPLYGVWIGSVAKFDRLVLFDLPWHAYSLTSIENPNPGGHPRLESGCRGR